MTDDFGTSTTSDGEGGNRNTTLIIIAVVVFVLLCCCCGSIALAWTYGDLFLETLEEFSQLPIALFI